MSTVTKRLSPISAHTAKPARYAPLLATAAALAISASSRADTNFYYGGGTSGTWDNGITADWASPNSNSTPLTTWINGNTSDAFFSTNSATITTGSNITANALNFLQSGQTTIAGNNTLTINSIFNTVGSQTINILDPVTSPGQLVIHGVTYPNSNGKGVTLGADTNILPGGVLLTGGSVYFNFANSANRYVVDGTHLNGLAPPFNSPGGSIPGSTAQNGEILVTSISGAGGVGSPAITVDGNGSTLTLASIHTNDYNIPNPIVLNPSDAANFYTAIGAGSVADSGTVASGPYPAYATMDFTGQISGNGNVIISNDFYGGGGKGFTVFSNPNNDYTGNTIVNNNGQNYLTFQIGAQGAIPAASNLVFGAKSVGASIGDTSITGKQLGAMDLNGFDTTVKSLSSDVATNLYCLGITNVDNHAIDAARTSGPHATDSSLTSTLTIDSAGTLNNTFFQGNIADGSDFLTQADATSGTYQGPFKGNATNYLPPSAGLKVAISLAPTNKGSLTLSATNGSTGNTTNVPDYGYTGGTTIAGGSLYVNGPLTAPSGSAASQVLVKTPMDSNHVAVLGGTGSINPNVVLQSGATLAPGSTPVPISTGSGSDFSNAPTAFNTGTLTVHNLTAFGGSQFNFVVNDGSTAAVAGTGFGNLTFSAGGTFTEDASVTAANPIYVHPEGTFSGFANYKSATWDLADFPTGTTLSNFTLDARNGYTPIPAALLANGTFSVTESGASVDLVFTPSPTVTALQYSGPANGTWNATANNTIWTDLVHGAGSVGYADPANVLFATPSSNTTITIQPAGVSPDSVIFNNNGSSVAYTITGGSINGAAPLSLNGTGRVILAAANAYSGGTGISGGGTIETRVSGALGSGNISIYSGTWNTTTNDQSYSLNVQVLGSGTTVSAIQTGSVTGSASGNLTLNGNISGSGTLTKAGLGTLTVNGTLSQAGDIDVTGGNLVINGTDAHTGTVSVSAGAGIEYNTAANATIGYQSSANLAGNLTFDKITNVTFSPGTYSANGNVILKANGSLIQGVGGVLGGNPVDIGNTIVLNPLNTAGFVAYIGMAGNGNRFWLHGPITGSGSVSFGAGPGQGGGANIDLFAQSTYTGNTSLDTGGQAILTLDVDNALPTTTNLTFGSNGQGAGFLDLNGHNQTVASLATDTLGGGFGGIEDSSGGGSITVNGSTSGEFKALISGFMSVNVALQNDAVLDLSYQGSNGSGGFGNTYAGPTTVTSGVLRFSNAPAFSPNTNIVLNGGVLEIHANNYGNFYNSLGTGGNQVQIMGGVSGFSAFGSQPCYFNFGGSNTTTGPTVVWSASDNFNPSALVLNQGNANATVGTNALIFVNNLDLGGATRTIFVNSTVAGATATISGSLSDGGLVKDGPGILILSNANTYAGGTTVNAGVLGAAVPHAFGTGSLTVHAGATAQLQSTLAGAAVAVSNLTLDGTTGAWTGGVDLGGGNKLVVNATALSKPATLAQIQDQVNFGKSHTAGIFSSVSLPSTMGVAVVDNGVLSAPLATFGGAAVNSNSVLVGAELLGDANIDGHVDLTDLSTVLNNFGSTTPAWTSGNFDGAPTIDLTDLSDVLNNFGLTNSNASLVFGGASVAAAPEPTSLGVLGLGVVALLSRRRKA
jgi:fibronectin-binding autotransporter adhesin